MRGARLAVISQTIYDTKCCKAGVDMKMMIFVPTGLLQQLQCSH